MIQALTRPTLDDDITAAMPWQFALNLLQMFLIEGNPKLQS